MKKPLDNSSVSCYSIFVNENNWGGRREGSGRKATGGNTVSITLTLSKAQGKLLRQYAADAKMSVSRLIIKKFGFDEDILPANLTGNRRLSKIITE